MTKCLRSIGQGWIRGFFSAAVLAAAGLCGAAPAYPGVVVEELDVGSALEKAGIEPGDLLLSWERLPRPPANPQGARGELASFFDWRWLEVEQAPRGTVTLTGRRGAQQLVFTVEAGLWKVAVRPRLSEELLADYESGRRHIDEERIREGTDVLRSIAQKTDEIWHVRCWLAVRIGEIWAEAGAWNDAHEAYAIALQEARSDRAKAIVWHLVGSARLKQSEPDKAYDAYLTALEVLRSMRSHDLGLARTYDHLGVASESRGQVSDAKDYYERARAILEAQAPGSLELASNLNNLGISAQYRGRLDEAESFYERALDIQQKLAPQSRQVADTLSNLGIVALNRDEFSLAAGYHRRALAIREQRVPASLEVAAALSNLGNVALEQGDLAAAEDYHQRALAIKERRAPDSLALAAALGSLGLVAVDRDDFDTAERYYQRALAILATRAPDHIYTVSTLNNLASVAWNRGDLAEAETYFKRALFKFESQVPESLYVAMVLNNLGAVADARGELDVAEEYHRRSLAIKEKLVPDSLQLADSLHNLGNIANSRADYSAAEEYYRRALTIKETLNPDSHSVAVSLNNLGTVAHVRSELELAEEYYRKAREIHQKLSPGSLDVATSLNNLGALAEARGELEPAKDYYDRALAIRMKLSPAGVDTAQTLYNLGKIAREGGHLTTAEDYYRRSLALREKLAPGTIDEARSLQELGALYRSRQRPIPAAEFLRRAVDALETQIGKLGSSRYVQGNFRAQHDYVYQGLIEVLVEIGHPEEAFHALERSRARSLLAMLAERDLIFSDKISPGLDKARRRLAVQYDRTLGKMGSLDAVADAEKIETLERELRALRQQRDEIGAEILEASPRLAALKYPRPLDLSSVRRLLDAGTAILSYSVGEARSTLFAVTRQEGLVVASLEVGEKELQDQVTRFRRLIQDVRPDSPSGSQREDAMRAYAHSLYATLVEPVEDLIDRHRRVLIVPDGPLHLVPFGALIRPVASAASTRGWQYLVEWKSLHTVLSATLYGELRGSSSADRSDRALVAFGDPLYPRFDGESVRDASVRSAVRSGLFQWDPLPFSRREVELISRLYPSSQTYLGAQATEEQAKSIGREVGLVHFATHGYLDDRLPLNSALALTLPEGFPEDRDNGLLQAWEIFEQLRLDADLVVLSACGSGLGPEQGGEGLISLTRAFQYAGARTVMASLWEVPDRTTPELMARFYHHLRSGMSKDLALQSAQVELIRKRIHARDEDGELVEVDASVPYFWAAFQLHGDWR